MRRFHSYGPVDCEEHFCVPRRALVEQCVAQLIDNPEKGGHYFTIWAPRQTGKTWLMRQVKQEIAQRYGKQFAVFNFSFGNLRGMGDLDSGWNNLDFPKPLRDILHSALPGKPEVQEWNDFIQLFARRRPMGSPPDSVDRRSGHGPAPVTGFDRRSFS